MSLVLRGVDFGPVSVASGTLNNFGEGWPYHENLKKFCPGFDFSGATLVSKTGTLAARNGNMPLDKGFQPLESRPKCIYVNPLKQLAVNAVGLSNPGMKVLLETGHWQKLQDEFMISFMAANGANEQERLDETEGFARLLLQFRPHIKFQSKFGIQVNISCPNTDHDPRKLASEAIGMGKIFRAILGDIPLDLKINALTPIKAIKLIQSENVFDALTCSNTIPWGMLPNLINWKRISSDGVSPLRKRGLNQDGGLSGAPLLPVVERLIREARADGVTMPITGGGGVTCADDVDRLSLAGLSLAGGDAIAIGSVAFLRPWNVKSIIQRAYKLSQRRR